MARSSSIAAQLSSGAIDRVEAALLAGHVGDEFDALVLSRRGDEARIQLMQPAVEARVARVAAAPGTLVRLRLDAASVDEGTVRFSVV